MNLINNDPTVTTTPEPREVVAVETAAAAAISGSKKAEELELQGASVPPWDELPRGSAIPGTEGLQRKAGHEEWLPARITFGVQEITLPPVAQGWIARMDESSDYSSPKRPKQSCHSDQEDLARAELVNSRTDKVQVLATEQKLTTRVGSEELKCNNQQRVLIHLGSSGKKTYDRAEEDCSVIGYRQKGLVDYDSSEEEVTVPDDGNAKTTNHLHQDERAHIGGSV